MLWRLPPVELNPAIRIHKYLQRRKSKDGSHKCAVEPHAHGNSPSTASNRVGDGRLLRDYAGKPLGSYRVMGGHWRPTPGPQGLPGAVVPGGCHNNCRAQEVAPRVDSSPTPHLPFEPPLEAEDSAFLPQGLQSPSMHVITSSFLGGEVPVLAPGAVPAQLTLSNWVLLVVPAPALRSQRVTSSLPRPGGSVPPGQCTWGINIGE